MLIGGILHAIITVCIVLGVVVVLYKIRPALLYFSIPFGLCYASMIISTAFLGKLHDPNDIHDTAASRVVLCFLILEALAIVVTAFKIGHPKPVVVLLTCVCGVYALYAALIMDMFLTGEFL